MKKLPWGIFAGISAMAVFFAAVGTIAAFIILDSIAGETNTSATLFDEWYQIVLFAAVIVFAIALFVSVTMCAIRAKAKKERAEEAADER